MNTEPSTTRPITPGLRAVAEEALNSAAQAEVPSTVIAYIQAALGAHIDADGSALQGMTVERLVPESGLPGIIFRLFTTDEEAECSWGYPSPAHSPAAAAVAFIRGAMHADINGVENPQVKRGEAHWEVHDNGAVLFTCSSWDHQTVAQAFADGCFTTI